ncbi:MAG: hypothetical protein IPP72_14475 [Chitinophagaceae bacterium]|nr:hypothetical protein [Chitinophagaceae bacterium]
MKPAFFYELAASTKKHTSMIEKKEKKKFIVLMQEAYVKMRPYIAAFLVIAIATSPVIPNSNWRIGVTSTLAVTLLFLIFDLFKDLTKRLDTIDNKLKDEEPPTFDNFTYALNTMKSVINDRLIKSKDVKIKILGVSAQYSWKNLVELTIPELFEIGHKNPKITIEIVIVSPQVLLQWGQPQLAGEAEHTIKQSSIFRETYKTYFEAGKIDVEIFEYDNIPHWHGVLIDDEIFFMGRCKWKLIDEKFFRLQVGQKEYRQFAKNDRFRGAVRIDLFKQWFNIYKLRANILKRRREKGRD